VPRFDKNDRNDLTLSFNLARAGSPGGVGMDRGATLVARHKELERIQRELDRAIQAVLDGVPGSQLKEKIGLLEARKAELTGLLADSKEPAPVLHPSMAEVYRRKVSDLALALGAQ
jgi:hypothetical protein